MTEPLSHLLHDLIERIRVIESRLTPDETYITSEESFFRRIAESTSDIIIESNIEGTMDFISPSITQLGYTPEELTGSTGLDLVHPDEQINAAQLLQEMSSINDLTTNLRIRHKEGHYVLFECKVNRFGSDINEPKVIVVARNVSQRHQIVQELQESIKEKEILLKEIHHRVKNNLQIISSMLNIQSRYFNDAQVREVFRECQNRIKSMALVHETLYMSKRLANIEFSGYIKTLVQRLAQSYRDISHKVSVSISIPEITLHIDIAVACGLIINELVTNSYKHGFPGDLEGNIWISLSQTNGKYALTVRDNGVGISKDIDLSKTNSMGLQLVTTLSHQLDADLDLDKINGTAITLIFSDQIPETQE
jgi:PAS domain S-box-containing protein